MKSSGSSKVGVRVGRLVDSRTVNYPLISLVSNLIRTSPRPYQLNKRIKCKILTMLRTLGPKIILVQARRRQYPKFEKIYEENLVS